MNRTAVGAAAAGERQSVMPITSLDKLIASAPGAKPVYLEVTGWLDGKSPAEIKAIYRDFRGKFQPQKAALAKVLGDKTVALMRGHGSVTVGTSLPQVVFRAYYAEMNAKLQSEAMKLGTVTYLTPEEAAAAAKTNDALVMRPWELWKRKAMKPE